MSNTPFETHGAFSWCELLTKDVRKAKSFYTEVLGWETEAMDMGPMGTYTVVKVGGAPIGGIMAPPAEAGNMPPMWTCYVTVDDVDKRAKDAERAGGRILVPPTDIPKVGRFSTIQDPTGAAISLITYAEKDD